MSSHDDDVEPGMYDEPQERLTRIAAAATEAIINHPENGDDVRAAFMIRDEQGGSGAALYGYPEGEEVSYDSLSDVVAGIGLLFQRAGIEMVLSTVARENPDKLLNGPEVPAGEDAGKPKVVLSILTDEPDPTMSTLCAAIKEAVEQTAGLEDTRLILVMDTGPDRTAVMHHGYPNHHAMAHGLFEAFQQAMAATGGHVAVIPFIDSLN